jgi:hypothetical protein
MEISVPVKPSRSEDGLKGNEPKMSVFSIKLDATLWHGNSFKLEGKDAQNVRLNGGWGS